VIHIVADQKGGVNVKIVTGKNLIENNKKKERKK